MLLNVDHFSALVRPRVISHAFVFEINNSSVESIEEWWQKVHYLFKYRSIFQSQQVIETFDKPLEDIFKEMNFGDLSESIHHEQSYVGQIVGFIVLYKNKYFFFDSKEKYKALEDTVPYKNDLHIISAAIKFYKGFEKTISEIIPKKICNNSQNYLWFYCRQHLLPLEHLIEFESIQPGDLVMTKNRTYLITSATQPNKPSFYKTGSWASKVFKVFCCNNSMPGKFFPNKKFKISKLHP